MDKAATEPFNLIHTYGRGLLTTMGPLILGCCSLPQAAKDAFRENGMAIPPQISGALILDTGSSMSCISLKTAEQLKLMPIRVTETLGAGGAATSDVYNVRFSIPTANPSGDASVFIWEQEVLGVPRLEEHYQDNGPLIFSGREIECIGIFGRDLLSYTRFYYDGVTGILRVDFDRSLIMIMT